MTESARVLLTDGEERSALAACRGLARAGYRVSAVAATRLAPAHWSRCCGRRLLAPSPLEDPDGFVERLREILGAQRHDVLLPASDAALLAISEQRQRLEPLTHLGLPPHDVVVRCLDKVRLLETTSALELEAPPSVVCHDEAEGEEAAARLGYPVVVKPARSLVHARDASLRIQPALLVRDEQALPAAVSAAGPVFVVQTHVDGGAVVSWAGVRADGRVPATACSRYRRTWLPDGGSACCSETIASPPVLDERLERFVASLGWSGVFEVEVLELGGGRYAILDFNARLYGSLALAIRAGANLPAIWCDALLGRTPGRVVALPGVRYRWEDAELRHLLWQLRRGRLREALRVLRPLRRVEHAHFRVRDPAPLLARALFLGGRIGRRRSGGDRI